MGFRGIAMMLAVVTSLFATNESFASLHFDPDPVAFSNGMVSGEISLVSVGTGIPAGGTVLEGTVGGTDDTFVFVVTITQGSIRRFGIAGDDAGNNGVTSNGAGVISGAGVDVSMFDAISGLNQRVFLFDEAGSQLLSAGQSSEQFFVAFDADALVEGSSINFMITPGIGLGSTFSIEVPLVPAPGAIAILATAGLVGCRRRRRV
jgi:hypothetical protein